MKILVLGGKGFIGRHAVAALQQQGLHPVIGSRKAANDPAQRKVVFHQMTTAKDWTDIAREFDVVLNCVGILRQVGPSTYDRVHHLAPAALATACREQDTRFIHLSALGLEDGDRSRFLTSKLRGERAIAKAGGNWIVVRPSLLDGEGGYGAAWLRGVAKLPVFAAPMDAKGQIAALMATDLGIALYRLCVDDTQQLRLEQSRIFELGGEQSFGFVAYIKGLRRRCGKSQNLAIPIPGIVARLGAHVCDLLHITPFSFGHWELLRKDNVPQINRLPELLGRPATPVITNP